MPKSSQNVTLQPSKSSKKLMFLYVFTKITLLQKGLKKCSQKLPKLSPKPQKKLPKNLSNSGLKKTSKKHQTSAQNVPKMDPQMDPKIIKNLTLSPHGTQPEPQVPPRPPLTPSKPQKLALRHPKCTSSLPKPIKETMKKRVPKSLKK